MQEARGRQASRQAGRQAGKQAHRQTSRQARRQAGGQASRQGSGESARVLQRKLFLKRNLVDSAGSHTLVSRTQPASQPKPTEEPLLGRKSKAGRAVNPPFLLEGRV